MRGGVKPRCAVVFVTDADFFLPTVVAADEVARVPGADAYRVLLFVEKGAIPDGFADWHASRGRPFEVIEEDFDSLPAGSTRFPRASFFRLHLPALLAGTTDRILYLDGDIEVSKPVADLFGLDLSGHAFAATDDLNLQRMDGTGIIKENRTLILRKSAGLQTPRNARYAQAGVLLIDVTSWAEREVTRRAVAFLSEHGDLCPFFDQDVLNVASEGQFTLVSPGWNYAPSFMSGVPMWGEPVITHFAGNGKPWYPPTWAGDPAAVERYRRYFASTPWPEGPPPAAWQKPRARFSLRKRVSRSLQRGRDRIRSVVAEAVGIPSRADTIRAYLRNTRFADVEQGLFPPFPDVGSLGIRHPKAGGPA